MIILALPFLIATILLFIKRNKSSAYRLAFWVSAVITFLIVIFFVWLIWLGPPLVKG